MKNGVHFVEERMSSFWESFHWMLAGPKDGIGRACPPLWCYFRSWRRVGTMRTLVEQLFLRTGDERLGLWCPVKQRSTAVKSAWESTECELTGQVLERDCGAENLHDRPLSTHAKNSVMMSTTNTGTRLELAGKWIGNARKESWCRRHTGL